jgi:hypothetical protein
MSAENKMGQRFYDYYFFRKSSEVERVYTQETIQFIISAQDNGIC